MPRRPCLDCSAITGRADSRCDGCARQRELRRGRRQQRGLDAAYDRARTAALASATVCVTCGEPFTAANPATGGHVVARRHGGTTADGIVAECRRCNYGWERTGS